MISVITPVYNGERFIESCLKAVIEQNCSDVEHIIIDGGSTDKTVEIVKQYVQKYPHIRWISEKDKGQSDAMNKGIAMAKGTILAILNVDDYYEPNVLNRISSIFQTLAEPSLLVGNCKILDDEDNLLEVNKPAKLKLAELLLGWKINPFPANPSAYFYHTSLHQKIGLYKVDDHYAMDLDFILRAVQVATVKYMNETWGNFQLHKNTKTFHSGESGQGNSRMKSIMEYYRKDLPLIQQWQIYLKYDNEISERVKYLLKKIRYFLANPYKLTLTLKTKFTKIFS